MKYITIQGRKVIFSSDAVFDFRNEFPASGLRNRAYWFEFDKNGDLVDTDVPEHDDGPGARALSEDAKTYLFAGEKASWMRQRNPRRKTKGRYKRVKARSVIAIAPQRSKMTVMLRKNAKGKSRRLTVRRGGKTEGVYIHAKGYAQRKRVKRIIRARHGSRGVKINPLYKRSQAMNTNPKTKQVFIQVQRGADSWHTVALVKDTPEMRVLAKRFAKTYKRKHPKEIVRVCTD